MNSVSIEARLDEFADVHGAVLLGMHQELLTIRGDTEGKLSETRALIEKFSSELKKQATELEQHIQQIEADSKQFRASSTATQNDASKALEELKRIQKPIEPSISEFKAKGLATLAVTSDLAKDMVRRSDQLEKRILEHKAAISDQIRDLRTSVFAQHLALQKQHRSTRIISAIALCLTLGLIIQPWIK